MRPLSPHTLSSAPIWRENFDKSFARAILYYVEPDMATMKRAISPHKFFMDNLIKNVKKVT